MMTIEFTKNPNMFVVELKSDKHSIDGSISQVVTTKIKPNSIGANHLKSDMTYNGEDAEVWVFDCGSANDLI